MSAAAVGSTAMGTAAVAFFVIVVAAPGIGIEVKLPCQQGFHRLIRVSGDSAEDLDPRLRQSHPGSAADAAADQRHHALLGQQSRQGPMAMAVGLHNPAAHHPVLLHLIELKGLGMAEMLKDLSIQICNRDFHSVNAPFWFFCPQYSTFGHKFPPFWKISEISAPKFFFLL